MEVGIEENPHIELSINSVVGLINLGTMKVKEKLHNEELAMRIDCGATHNFILKKLVTSLNLPTKETSNYGVILGLGTTIKGKGICGNVEFSIGDWKVVDNFLPLELRGIDIILGIEWLHSLGVTKVDWQNLSMTF